jgi:hypothetical protein
LLTTSVRGSGDEPTMAASSGEGCRGFARAEFGFLLLVASAIVKLRCYTFSYREKGRTMASKNLKDP